MNEHLHSLTTDLSVALWSLTFEKEAGQKSALFSFCSDDWDSGMDR